MGSNRTVCARQLYVAAYRALLVGVWVSVSAQNIGYPNHRDNVSQDLTVTQPLDVGFDIGAATREPGIFFSVGALRSDNIQRTADSPQADELAHVGLTGDVRDSGPRFEYGLLADLEWADFVQKTFRNQVLGYLDGDAGLWIVPNTFRWTARETLNQLSGDPLQASTPGSLTLTSYFTTGPSLLLRPGAQMTIVLSGEYGRTDTGTAYLTNQGRTNLNSNRYRGVATLEHGEPRVARIGVTAGAENVRYDRPELSTAAFDSRWLYASYEAGTTRNHMLLSAGYKQAALPQKTVGIPTFRIEIGAQITASSTLQFMGSQELADSLELGRSDLRSITGQAVETRALQIAPSRVLGAGAAWIFKRYRNQVTLTANWTKETSDFAPVFNRNSRSGEASYVRLLRPTIRLDLRVALYRDQYTLLHVTDKEWRADAGLSYRPSTRHSFSLRYQHFDRGSSQASTRFRENRIGLEFVVKIL